MRYQGRNAGFVAIGALLLTLAGTFLWTAILVQPLRLGTGLLDARRHLDKAQRKLTAGATDDARLEGLRGEEATARARAGLDDANPLLDLATAVPAIGDLEDDLDHLVAAAESSAGALTGTIQVAGDALEGPDRIIESDGKDTRIRIDRIQDMTAVAEDVENALSTATTELEAVDRDDLPGRAREALDDGLEQGRDALAQIEDALAGLDVLPGILGAEDERTYLIGFQNTAEQRGTGGAILQFATITFDDGSADFETAESVYQIDRNRKTYSIPLPKEAWYNATIEDAQRFGNANWSPDWPLSANLMLDYAERAEPSFPEVDGVIAVDPIAVQDLIPGTGSYVVEDFGHHVTAKTAVHFLLYKAYASYPIPSDRRTVLRKVVDQFYDRLLDPARPTQLVSGFGSALREKHAQIWMRDPDEQRFVRRMNWDAAIESGPGATDYLYVVEQNVGGNKLDYFSRNSTTMDVRFDGGTGVVTTTTKAHNGVFLPQPRWSMGDSKGLHRPMLNLYVPRQARLLDAEVRGKLLPTPAPAVWTGGMPPEHVENGRKAWSGTLEIPPGKDGSLSFRYRVPGALYKKAEDLRSGYRLLVQAQPKIHPDELRVRVHLPDGASDVDPGAFELDGDTLIFEGVLKEDLVLEATWRS